MKRKVSEEKRREEKKEREREFCPKILFVISCLVFSVSRRRPRRFLLLLLPSSCSLSSSLSSSSSSSSSFYSFFFYSFFFFFVVVGSLTQEDLTIKDVDRILDMLAKGETPKPGPQNGRRAAEPITGQTTLLSEPPGPGFGLRKDGAL